MYHYDNGNLMIIIRYRPCYIIFFLLNKSNICLIKFHRLFFNTSLTIFDVFVRLRIDVVFGKRRRHCGCCYFDIASYITPVFIKQIYVSFFLFGLVWFGFEQVTNRRTFCHGQSTSKKKNK